MKIAVSPAYALGLLAQLQRQQESLRTTLQASEAQAADVATPLADCTARHRQALEAARSARLAAARAAKRIAAANTALTAHARDMAALNRRAEEFNAAARAATDGAAQLELRRSRAALMVQVNAIKRRVERQTAEAAEARQEHQAARQSEVGHLDAVRLSEPELLRLQAVLPRPQLFLRLFEVQAAQAHCAFVVDRQVGPWATALTRACESVRAVHTDLQAGRYPLEQHNALLGGRELASAEALYAHVALGQWAEARALMVLVTDPELFFHDIFHVFRAWCLRLYLSDDRDNLQQLLELHRYAQGSRGAYAQAFLALLQGDAGAFDKALQRLVQSDWQAFRRLPQRGMGLVNVPALGLLRLAAALQRHWRLPALGPTVPEALHFLPNTVCLAHP